MCHQTVSGFVSAASVFPKSGQLGEAGQLGFPRFRKKVERTNRKIRFKKRALSLEEVVE